LSFDENKVLIQKLEEEHTVFYTPIFDCYDPNEFPNYDRRLRKRIKELSENMNYFIRYEALDEQNLGLNTTFLLFYEERMAGYISLCSDSIKLAEEEMREKDLPYATVPAIKIARLSIDHRFQRRGFGKRLIDFAATRAFIVRNEYCGVKFLTLDCYKHRLSYYKKFGFQQNSNQENGDLFNLWLNVDEYLEKLDPSIYS